MKSYTCTSGTQPERDQFSSDCPDSLRISTDSRLLMQSDWRKLRQFCPQCNHNSKSGPGASRAFAVPDTLTSGGNPPCKAARVFAMLLTSAPLKLPPSQLRFISTLSEHVLWRTQLTTYGLPGSYFNATSVLPLAEFDDMVQRMRDGRSDKTPADAAVRARDVFLVKLLAAVPLRARETARLTWRESNIAGRYAESKPHLYQRPDGTWWVLIPDLKQHRSRDWPLPGSIRHDLERYLLKHRRALVRQPTDLVFLFKTQRRQESVGDFGSRKRVEKHAPHVAVRRHVEGLVHRYLGHSDDACASAASRTTSAMGH